MGMERRPFGLPSSASLDQTMYGRGRVRLTALVAEALIDATAQAAAVPRAHPTASGSGSDAVSRQPSGARTQSSSAAAAPSSDSGPASSSRPAAWEGALRFPAERMQSQMPGPFFEGLVKEQVKQHLGRGTFGCVQQVELTYEDGSTRRYARKAMEASCDSDYYVAAHEASMTCRANGLPGVIRAHAVRMTSHRVYMYLDLARCDVATLVVGQGLG